jgi:chromosome segregation ATPase
MKDFLAAPSLQGIYSLETRRQVHLAAIAAIEAAVTENIRLTEAASMRNITAPATPDIAAQNDSGRAATLAGTLEAIEARYTALEQRASDQERIIAAFNSQGSEHGRMIAEFEADITRLRTENTALQAANINQQETLNRRDSEIVALRTDTANKEQQLADLNRSLANLQNQVQAAGSRASQNQAALEQQQRENASLVQEKENLQRQYDGLLRQYDAVREAARSLLGE